MKKIGLISLFFSFSILVFSQTTYSSGHYVFSYPENFKGIEEVSVAITALRSMFDEVFRFDSENNNNPCSIVILPDQTSFESYVSNRIGEIRSQYVFLKYSTPALSELVLYPKKIEKQSSSSVYASFSGPNLNRQLFLQYLYNHISEPPVWIRDGFQAYFETATWDVRTASIEETTIYPWLETVKTAFSNSEQKIPISSLLSAVTGSYEASRMYPQAWAFATFCMSSERSEYQRFLHESFMVLSGDARFNGASQQENTDSVKNRFIRYISLEDSENDFALWLSEKYTYNELIQEGVYLYNTGEYATAKKRLNDALKIRRKIL